MIDNPAHAWGELVRASKLPPGYVGLLVSTEIAAFMSTLSALINWGSSFLVNDFYREYRRGGSPREEIWVSRATSVFMFVIAGVMAILLVEDMISWFLFINSVVVIFWLPLAYFRFFWSRFNAWGEMAATLLSLPIGWIVWFTLDFQSRPFWQGAGLLFFGALAVIVAVTLLTPAEPREVQVRFFRRCRPMAGWHTLRRQIPLPAGDPPLGRLVADCFIGMVACLGLVMATNAVFVKDGLWTVLGLVMAVGFGGWLIQRSIGHGFTESESAIETEGTAGSAAKSVRP